MITLVLIKTVDIFFRFLYFLVVARVMMSWFPIDLNSKIVRFIWQVTEPILEPFRAILSKLMPPRGGFYLDFSPVIALIVLNILKQTVISILVKIMI